MIEHGRWRIEPSKEGIPLVFGDGKYPHDPPRIASELESSLAAAYAGAVARADAVVQAWDAWVADDDPLASPAALKAAIDGLRGPRGGQ